MLKSSITKKHIKKIMMVLPPRAYYLDGTSKRTSPPLGIAYISAVLLQNGYEVSILDSVIEGFTEELTLKDGRVRYGLSSEEIARRVAAFNPDFVGVSCLFSSQHDLAEEVMKLVKDVNPGIVTAAGGYHPTFLPEQVIANDNLDFIVLGEADFSIMSLMKALESGDMSKADGVVYKQDGKIHTVPKRGFIEDLDSIPYPARHLLPMDKYSGEGTAHGDSIEATPYTPVMTSRACVISCSFCASRDFWGKKYRTRSAKNVVDEIEHLVKDYGIREIHFEDDNLTADKKRAKEIFRMMLDRKLNIPWATPNGIALYTLDDEMIELMKESGCYRISLAVESGCQEVLDKIIEKPLKLDKVRAQVKKIKEVGLRTHAWYTIGYPDETLEQIYETIRYAKELGTEYASFNIVAPLPGSKVYKIAKERGLVKEPMEWSKLELGKGVISTDAFSADDIKLLRKDAWLYVNGNGTPSPGFMANI